MVGGLRCQNFSIDLTNQEKEDGSTNQPGVTKGNSRLINPVALYDGVTTLVDRGRDIDVLYVDFYKAFDTVTHNILHSKLDWYRFDGWTVL